MSSSSEVSPLEAPAIGGLASAVGPPLAYLADEINELHHAIEDTARRCLRDARRCGELLLLAKKDLTHGEFGPWLRSNCHFSKRAAQDYMAIAREWPRLEDTAKAQPVAHLGVGAALKLLRAPLLSTEPNEGSAPHTDAPTALRDTIDRKRMTEPFASDHRAALVERASARRELRRVQQQVAKADERVRAIERAVVHSAVQEMEIDLAPEVLETLTMSDAEVRAHYKANAPAEDLKFFLRNATMSDELRADARSLLVLVQQRTLTGEHFDAEYRRLKMHWRGEMDQRDGAVRRVHEPVTGLRVAVPGVVAERLVNTSASDVSSCRAALDDRPITAASASPSARSEVPTHRRSETEGKAKKASTEDPKRRNPGCCSVKLCVNMPVAHGVCNIHRYASRADKGMTNVCFRCRQRFAPGDWITWANGYAAAQHATCVQRIKSVKDPRGPLLALAED